MHITAKTLLITLLSFGLLTSLAGCNSRGPGHWLMDDDSHQQRKIQRISSRLSLDENQTRQLDALFEQFNTQRNNLRDEQRNLPASLNRLIAGESFDRTAAQQLLEQKIALLQDRAPQMLAALADFYDNLRPEQQQLLRDQLNERQSRGTHRQGYRF